MKNFTKIVITLHTLLVFNTNVCANNKILPKEVITDVTSIVNCLKEIIDIHYFKTIIMTHDVGNSEEEFGPVTYAINTIAEVQIPMILTKETELEDKKVVLRDDNLYVLYMHKCEALSNFNWTHFNILVKHIVITLEYCRSYMKEITDKVYALDLTFIMLKVSRKHELITFIPTMAAEFCKLNGVAEPLHVNTCYNSSMLRKNRVFPTKNPKNLQGCSIKVGLYLVAPFAMIPFNMIHNLTVYEELDSVKGSDIELLKLIAKHLNATLKFHFLTYVENETNFCKDFLKNDSIDLCAGGLERYPMDLDDLVYTDSYITQALIWIHSVRRNPQDWTRILSRFKGLFLFFIFYLCYCFCYNIINYIEGYRVNFSDILFYSWGAFFGASSLPQRIISKHKLLNIFLLISSVCALPLVTSQINSFLTIELPPKVYRSQNEIVSSELQPFMNPTLNYSSSKTLMELFKISSHCYNPMDCASKVLENEGMTIINVESFKWIHVKTAINFEARIVGVSDNVFTKYAVLILKKDHFISQKVQNISIRLFETGIYGKLYREGLGLDIYSKSEIIAKNLRTLDFSCKVGCRLKLEKILPAFYGLTFGYLVALIVFILEILSNKRRI